MVDKVGGVEFDVDIDSTGAVSAGSKIIQNNEKIEDSFQDIDLAAKKSSDTMVKGSKKAGKAIGGMGRNVGMAGVQIGQFAGQIQGGQSALLAFSQQGADIGMLFGPAGMIAGGIVAVGAALAGVLVPSLFEATETTEDLAKALRELQKENKLTEAQTKFLAQADAEAAEAKKKKIEELKAEFEEKEAMISQFSQLRAAEIKAAKDGEVNATVVGGYTNSIMDLRKELVRLQAQLDIESGATGGPTDEAKEEARKASESANARISALKTASEIENKLIRAKNEEGYRIRLDGMSMAESAQIAAWEKEKIRLEASSNARIAMMQSEAQKAQESKILSEEQKLQIANEYGLLELEQKSQRDAKIEQAEEDHTKKMLKIKEMEESSKRKAVAGAFGDLSQLMNTESRKLFEIGKAAALASAVITGYDAAVANYKKGSEIGGPPVGAAFAAASLAATFAQVRAIQSTSFGGSGSGQSIQGGQVSNNVNGGGVGPQQNNQDISISVTGGDDAGRSILNLVNMTIANGGKIGGG